MANNLTANEAGFPFQFDDKDFLSYYRARLLELQGDCQRLPQVGLPLKHDFAPGVYARRIFMPAGTFVIGKTHKTEHLNIVLSGIARVMVDGKINTYAAGSLFVSKAGAKKVLYIISDMTWCTIHPTEETNLDELKKICVCSEEEEKKLFAEEIKKYGLRDKEKKQIEEKQGE